MDVTDQYILKKGDLQARFADRLSRLDRASEQYDQGQYDEAEKMSSFIVQLLGDRTNSKGKPSKSFESLTTKLGRKPTEMIDCSLQGVMDKSDTHGPISVVSFTVPGIVGMSPLLDGFEIDAGKRKPVVSFDQWWNAPVLRDSRYNKFTRRYLVETLRDKVADHSDGVFPKAFWYLNFGQAYSVQQVEQKGSPKVDTNAARVAIRHIAHEVLRSLDPGYLPGFYKEPLRPAPLILFRVVKPDSQGSRLVPDNEPVIEVVMESTSNATAAGWHQDAKWTQMKFSGQQTPPEISGASDLGIQAILVPMSGHPPPFGCEISISPLSEPPEWAKDGAYEAQPQELE